jgi:hypothetical protein
MLGQISEIYDQGLDAHLVRPERIPLIGPGIL